MAIEKGHRFPIDFGEAFPQGLVLVGELSPDTEYQSREDRAAGRPVRQRVDEATGKRQWKATVTDPHEPKAKRASFEVTFLADVQPVPNGSEALPGMRPIELDELTAEPKVAGTGGSSTSRTCSVLAGSRRLGPAVAGARSRPSRVAALPTSHPPRPREAGP